MIIIIIILIILILYYVIYPTFYSVETMGSLNDEALGNISSLSSQYNKGTVTISNLTATGDITGQNITANEHITTGTLKNAGRLHLGGDEKLYILNKEGVMVGKEWGGNGKIDTQGPISAWEGLYSPTMTLGNKFRLSGVGDGQGNDEWLRLTGPDGKGYAGGFATDKIWANNLSANNINVTGSVSSNRFKYTPNAKEWILEYYIKGDGKVPLIRIHKDGNFVQILNEQGRDISSTGWANACRTDRGGGLMDGVRAWNWHSCGSDCGC